MPKEEDYYQVLGIAPDATDAQIREAYLFWVNILHPDRLMAMPERIRYLAEEQLKKVIVAYSILSNPEKRRSYDSKNVKNISVTSDSQNVKSGIKPKPEVYPKVVRIDNALPYVKQKGEFFVRNVGGSFKKLYISKPPDWITVVATNPLCSGSKLPMRVQIEAVDIQWGKVYSSQIVVRLDESEVAVKIELRTQKKPR